MVHDHFWENVHGASIEAEVPAENRGSDGGVQNFQTLIRDNNDGLWVTIPTLSMIRTRVERSER